MDPPLPGRIIGTLLIRDYVFNWPPRLSRKATQLTPSVDIRGVLVAFRLFEWMRYRTVFSKLSRHSATLFTKEALPFVGLTYDRGSERELFFASFNRLLVKDSYFIGRTQNICYYYRHADHYSGGRTGRIVYRNSFRSC